MIEVPGPDDTALGCKIALGGLLIAIALAMLSCGRETEPAVSDRAPVVALPCPQRAEASVTRTRWVATRDTCPDTMGVWLVRSLPVTVDTGTPALSPAVPYETCDRLRVDPDGECRELVYCHASVPVAWEMREYNTARVVSVRIRERVVEWFQQIIEWPGGFCVVEADHEK